MEILIQLIFIIAFIKYCTKAMMNGGKFRILAYSMALSIIILGIYPIVITQPITVITNLLNDSSSLSNMAVIITGEALFGIWISLTLLDSYLTPSTSNKPNRLIRFLWVIPEGVIIICATAYAQLLFISNRVGSSFMQSSIIFAIAVFLAVLILAVVIKYGIRHYDLAIKFNISLNIAILICGLLLSSAIAGYNNPNSAFSIEWTALIAILILTSLLFCIGAWLHKTGINHKYNHKISQIKSKIWN